MEGEQGDLVAEKKSEILSKMLRENATFKKMKQKTSP
jgi:hypothetical protein